MHHCRTCGVAIEEGFEERFVAFDLQKDYEKETFCSAEHRKSWMTKKIIWMCVSLAIGVLIAFEVSGFSGFFVLFLPYMIRQARHSLTDVFNGGTLGEIISFCVVLLGTVTVIYPLYKLVQEIKQYVNLKKRHSL